MSAQDWISIKDSLPEVGIPVLLFLSDSGNEKLGDRYSVDYRVNMADGRTSWDFFNDDEMTHWQPLPEPPHA